MITTASICPFKEGELITCINNAGAPALTFCETYVVQTHNSNSFISPSVSVIDDRGRQKHYLADRFIKVAPLTELTLSTRKEVIALADI